MGENTKPNFENFQLQKVKLLKNGGLSVHYDVVELIDGATFVNRYTVDNNIDVHDDLKHLFSTLRVYVAQAIGMDEIFKDQETSKMQEHLDKIKVTDVAISGKGDNVGVVISSILSTLGNLATKITTPRLKLKGEITGEDPMLAGLVTILQQEVYAYLFEGKKAKMELFGSEE